MYDFSVHYEVCILSVFRIQVVPFLMVIKYLPGPLFKLLGLTLYGCLLELGPVVMQLR